MNIDKKIQEVRSRQKLANSFNALVEKSQEIIESHVVNNNVEILAEKLKEVDEQIEGANSHDDLIKIITNMFDSLKGLDQEQNLMLIRDEIRKMLHTLQLMESKPVFNEKKFERTIDKSFNSIAKTLEIEVPEKVEYKRDERTEKIEQVIESYTEYTLYHDWKYDRKGNLTEVITNRVETT